MGQKLELAIRRRVVPGSTYESHYERVLDQLEDLGGDWKPRSRVRPVFPRMGGGLCTVAGLSKFLPEGVRGQVTYIYRDNPTWLEDSGRFDDTLILEFNSSKIDYEMLIRSAVPKLVDAFEGYRAHIANTDTILADFDFERAAGVDYRNTLTRFHHLTWLDKELCTRALGQEPEVIVSKLAPAFEVSRLLSAGAYLVPRELPCTPEQLESIDRDAWGRLGLPVPRGEGANSARRSR